MRHVSAGANKLIGMLTLLFYVLIVGLVAAMLFLLASVVFGRGEELGPLPEGTTATVLPAEGISGADVRALRFQQVVRGYKAGEVDWALARLAARIEELQLELAHARGGEGEVAAGAQRTAATPVPPRFPWPVTPPAPRAPWGVAPGQPEPSPEASSLPLAGLTGPQPMVTPAPDATSSPGPGSAAPWPKPPTTPAVGTEPTRPAAPPRTSQENHGGERADPTAPGSAPSTPDAP